MGSNHLGLGHAVAYESRCPVLEESLSFYLKLGKRAKGFAGRTPPFV